MVSNNLYELVVSDSFILWGDMVLLKAKMMNTLFFKQYSQMKQVLVIYEDDVTITSDNLEEMKTLGLRIWNQELGSSKIHYGHGSSSIKTRHICFPIVVSLGSSKRD